MVEKRNKNRFSNEFHNYRKKIMNGVARELKFFIVEGTIFEWAKQNNLNILDFNLKNYKFIFNKIHDKLDYSGIADFMFLTSNPTLDEQIDYCFNNYIGDEEKEKNKKIKKFMDNLGIIGRPDYFIWKGDFFSFVEYKSLCDGLRKEQIEWFVKNDKLPIIIVHSLKKIKVNDLKKLKGEKTKLPNRKNLKLK